MEVISSRDNKSYKELAKLLRKKYRDISGSFILEGPDLVREAIENDKDCVIKVFLREDVDINRYGDDALVLSKELFKTVSDTDNSQGVIAVIKKPESKSLSESAADDNWVLILDRLQDPGNIGTIIRTAEASGCGLIAIVKGTSDPFSPKVVRSCAGSCLRVPLTFCESSQSIIDKLKALGYRLAVTSCKEGTDLYDAKLGEIRRTAIVIGNEGNGVSDLFLKEADIKINIPMMGKIESLNAGVAAGLVMYEMMRFQEI